MVFVRRVASCVLTEIVARKHYFVEWANFHPGVPIQTCQP